MKSKDFKILSRFVKKERSKKMLAKLWFYVEGNPKDSDGKLHNPMPAPRQTGKSRFTKRGKEYEEWKSYIWQSFKDSLECDKMGDIWNNLDKYKLRFKIFVVFNTNRNVARGDLDNIGKAVVDALQHKKNKKRKIIEERLFDNDKNVVSDIDYVFGEKPCIEVVIEIVKRPVAKFERK